MTRGNTLTIVYPMWNEESSIHLAVAAAREAAGALVVQGELADYAILIVDDASSDATARIADELAASDPRIDVVHHQTNQGLGGSICTGSHMPAEMSFSTRMPTCPAICSFLETCRRHALKPRVLRRCGK